MPVTQRSRILFVLKRQRHYGSEYGPRPMPEYGRNRYSGLYNSALFVVQMLNKFFHAKLVEVVDNNDIDREVSEYKPTHVVIEALWVVPEKFEILHRLHPNVQWIVRIHSEIPFLAMEGVAISWIKQYVQYENVRVSANSRRAVHDLDAVIGGEVLYLPNYFPKKFESHRPPNNGNEINIGCFGAIRPLKNQLVQAIAGMAFANKNNIILNFFVNAGRIERGEEVLKSLRSLFQGTPHALKELGWLNRREFLNVVSTMDLAMSVSLTETFSLVTSDAISQGVPVVTSPEVGWSSRLSQASPTSVPDIENKIAWSLKHPGLNVYLNQRKLRNFSNQSEKVWVDYLS